MNRLEKIQLLNRIKKGLVNSQEFAEPRLEIWTSNNRIGEDFYFNKELGISMTRDEVVARRMSPNDLIMMTGKTCDLPD